ncbi:MAG: hypothetical protein IKZ87_01545 [Actinomycetaceae bacterium]|nr:hypothetical protein [Actinomycetaceae bacterium]
MSQQPNSQAMPEDGKKKKKRLTLAVSLIGFSVVGAMAILATVLSLIDPAPTSAPSTSGTSGGTPVGYGDPFDPNPPTREQALATCKGNGLKGTNSDLFLSDEAWVKDALSDGEHLTLADLTKRLNTFNEKHEGEFESESDRLGWIDFRGRWATGAPWAQLRTESTCFGVNYWTVADDVGVVSLDGFVPSGYHFVSADAAVLAAANYAMLVYGAPPELKADVMAALGDMDDEATKAYVDLVREYPSDVPYGRLRIVGFKDMETADDPDRTPEESKESGSYVPAYKFTLLVEDGDGKHFEGVREMEVKVRVHARKSEAAQNKWVYTLKVSPLNGLSPELMPEGSNSTYECGDAEDARFIECMIVPPGKS